MSEKFPVVGIGSSAGGLEALTELFRHMPRDSGLAFVLVSHYARGTESSLPEILGRSTRVPVRNATPHERIEPNQIYVCPPDYIVTVADGHLQLHLRTSETQRKPIDVFLSSLAEIYGELAVGILLSGGGSDGTIGVKAIKERGGLTMAQIADGDGPQQSGMPDTAIAAGVIDLELPAHDMAGRLIELTRKLRREADVDDFGGQEDSRKSIARILLNQVGHDFTGYTIRTFMRRVHRRMQVLQVENLNDYVQRLEESPDEVNLLFRDLLIGVTNFFRDPGAFESLEKMVIPKLFENRGAAEMVRIWIPGCATGEEVYSIAILVREHMDSVRTPPKIQIFATDIDEQALAVARVGRYPTPLLEHVSEARLRRFFVGDDVTYAVSKEIRDMCMFSSHSLIRDPPFSRIDMISCRNLLIYFGAVIQAQAVPIFHFALRKGGYLFLGTSENVTQHADLFTPVDKKHRIFQRRDNVAPGLQFSQFPAREHRSREMRHDSSTIAANVRRGVEARIMERHAPAHVVVDRDGDILHYSPRTGKYLEPAAGLPNRHLAAMARRGLRLDVRAAMREALETRRLVIREGIAVELEDRTQLIDLSVEPFNDNAADPLFLVIFQDRGLPISANERDRNEKQVEGTTDRLEQELRDTRERLQATIEEYETAVEELKSSNEELQSINEELQSTNEELETSKEELQSVNEELQTVNSELNAKVEEVDQVNADLKNVFESTRIATVFLDHNLVIRSFTPAVTSIFNLIASDKGRPLTDIVSKLDADASDLKREMQSVLETGTTIERDVRRRDGGNNSYLMRILPYRGRNNVIDGVLITFSDVTALINGTTSRSGNKGWGGKRK